MISGVSREGSYVATEDLVTRGINLCKQCTDFYGGTEDGSWARVIPVVSSHFARQEFMEE